ncbi:putative viral nucleocapsid [Crithidia abscondita leishbunyavirus]|uniref:Putative viral nucleocapsid n=1 Tax=Crithidia abscondita leishbunyavirus TaxID=1888351 RepID=A0A2R2Q2M6_9VIRU|nr:putative viral nucleocapsid [Crithidia abscondita leishbunyavirus]
MSDSTIIFDLSLVESLSYLGVSPYDTRLRIIERGLEDKAKIVALMVGCRGTNLSRILTRSSNPEVAAKVVNAATTLQKEMGVSLGHIAAAFPEVVYDSRVKSGSNVSVNTLAFLKHNGLTKEKWLDANRDFCELVGLDYSNFLKISDVIWADNSFSGIVGKRSPV